ncbi:MAG: lysophospholipid acyltransferase family protein [Pseudomonadota bacterium]
MTTQTTTETVIRPAVDRLVPLRVLYRLPLLLLHIFIALPPTLLVTAYGQKRSGAAWRRAQRWAGWWSGKALWIFGFRVRVEGEPAPDPVVFVANHLNWADIELIHSHRLASFVAKAEISKWPLVGYMAKAGGSVFHQRGRHDSLARVTAAIRERLEADRSVALFPEGRTGPGRPVLPFHGRLLQAAIETRTPLQPVAIGYYRAGEWSDGIAFRAGESFGASLVRLLGQPPTEALLHFLPTRVPADEGRSALARWARDQVVTVVDPDNRR